MLRNSSAPLMRLVQEHIRLLETRLIDWFTHFIIENLLIFLTNTVFTRLVLAHMAVFALIWGFYPLSYIYLVANSFLQLYPGSYS